MSAGLQVAFQVHFTRGGVGRKQLRAGPVPAVPGVEPTTGTVPRVARLLALAIRLDAQVRQGALRDGATVARLGHVSRARVTQIMNLLNLAPDIQEEILFLRLPVTGGDALYERDLRPIAAEYDWNKQRRLWRALRAEGRP